VSTLIDWNKAFDKDMNPIVKPEKRGKACKVTTEVVRQVVEAARELKGRGKRIRLKQFTGELAGQGVILSRKTVGEILIANGLREPETRRRRPRFYQSLRQRIPNGLLSIDGGEFTVCLDGDPIKLTLELGVDVGTFTHTAFSIGDTETTAGVLDVLRTHIGQWGCPVGIVCDHGSANMSGEVARYIEALGMEFVPAGPANPKGNGTLESAIGQMKQIIGTVQLDTSSPGALAKSVLDAIVRVYVKMRNKLPLRRKNESPLENFTKPVEEDMIEFERQRLKQHKADKSRKSDDQAKIKRLRFLIQNKQIPCDPLAVKRAEKTITGYDMKAIIASEEAFIKAVTRKPERLNLPYFFGILRNIQKQHDDEAYQQYCRQRYNHRQMLEWQRRLQPPEKKPPTIDQILGMLERALVSPSQSVRRLCMKLARIWTGELTDGRRYLEPLRKKFMEAIAKLKHLRIEQKDQMVDYIQQFFNMKSGCDCVT
jgi:hypothetical protein